MPELKNPVKTEFAVDMTCDSCVRSVQSALSPLPGVKSVDVSLPEKRVLIESTTPPSILAKALQSTGLSAVLRGQGAQNHLGAAVCIFESFSGAKGWAQNNNKGLARLVQVDQDTCLVDVTVDGMPPGTHSVAVHECGDISGGCASTGQPVVQLGTVEIDNKGRGNLVAETQDIKVWDAVGRSIVLDRVDDKKEKAASENAVCGIIARSAGLFQNTKMVCSCSGQTLWEEARM
ncbi:copper chaperone [Borealophlyctis nickersoniae]|nr:copper chaperone [Borealophlyctis nickersoniae]